jgi:hypothetical protein
MPTKGTHPTLIFEQMRPLPMFVAVIVQFSDGTGLKAILWSLPVK